MHPSMEDTQIGMNGRNAVLHVVKDNRQDQGHVQIQLLLMVVMTVVLLVMIKKPKPVNLKNAQVSM